ncbi:hypothetical protein [Nevskia ramosa]|uniref:hypothetical protein n=1 Tax=Nevskia ramosa TaxID=64002 RepID=UPI002352E1DC|nr:hypothetical protein [Nevskia ramosa]
MITTEALAADWPPTIKTDSLSSEETLAVHALTASLHNAKTHLLNFHSALSLFNANFRLPSENQKGIDTASWKDVAFRDGAMTVFHFGKTIEGVRNYLNLHPTPFPFTKPKVDLADIKESVKMLKASFPFYEDLRHAVAHAGELNRTAETMRSHTYSGTISFGDEMSIQLNGAQGGHITHGNTFFIGFEGKILSYELSEKSLSNMTSIRDVFWRAFSKCKS